MNLMSIGGKSPLTGPDPPKPAIIGRLNTHAGFESDTSLTCADFFFGDNHSFNQTLFNEFVDFSNKFGGGVYDLIPTPLITSMLTDSAVALALFIDRHKADGCLNLKDALGFFRDMCMPNDLHCNNGSKTGQMVGNALSAIFAAHPVQLGSNNGTVNSYMVDPTLAIFNDRCKLYANSINIMVHNLYSNPTGILRENLNANLDFFCFFKVKGCMQLFPYGH
ncbi:hypothetical protein M422DRAFT_258733 [Sphaerobolus stellatus SS14]|uniref:Heme haloperoxidase family profile domain-containing protein n=1 Tax=Sphaerobolus stellatus (strain SS14) TaxID=990650 RepID=A0A0C9UUS1_SPHS4|nr:hypothetical protein M422DRAFT_258733 [Sphaerobolus stellatus SS14]